MNLLDLSIYVPGFVALAVAALVVDLTRLVYRRLRPVPVRCARCGGTDVGVVLRLPGGDRALHTACLPKSGVALSTPFTGTWRDVRRILDALDETTQAPTEATR